MSVTSITPHSVCLVSETGYVCYVHYAFLCVSGVWDWIMSVTSITPRSVCLVSETGYVCYVHYASLCVSGVWDWICLLRPLRLSLCVWCLRLDMSVTSITPRSVCLVSETGYVCYVHYAFLCVSGVWDWIMSVTSITPRSVCLVSETGYVCYVHYASFCVSGVWDWICLLRPLRLTLCVWCLRLDNVCYVHHASLCVSGVWDWICLLRPLRLALCVWCLRLDVSVTSITPHSVCLVSETGYVCYVHYASLCVSGVWDWICLLRPLRLTLCVWCLRLDMSVTSITPHSVCLVFETGYVCNVHYASLCVSGGYVCYVHYASLCVSGVWDWIRLLRPLRLALCVWCLRLDMSVTSITPHSVFLVDMSVTSITPRSVFLVSETGYVCYVHYASLCVSGVWDWICLLRPLRLTLCVWCLRLDMSVTSITPRSVFLVSETGYVCYVHYASLCVSGVWDWICLLRPLRLTLCFWWICLLRPLRLALCFWCLRLDKSVTSITPRSVCLVFETGYVCYVHYASLCVSGVWDWICLLRSLRLALCVWCLRLDMSVTSITPHSVCLVSETGYVCYVHYASLCVSGVWDWICLLRPLRLTLCVWWICLLRPLRLALCVWCLRLDMSVTSITPHSVCLVSETGYVCYVHYASLCVSGGYVCYVHYASLCVSGVWDWICLLRPLRLALCFWCLRLDTSVTSITPRSVCLVFETGYVCYVHYASLCVSGVWDWICLLRSLRLALCVWCLRLDMSVTSITPRSVCLVSETGYVCYVHYASLCVSGVWDWICLLRPLRLALCVWCLRLDMSVTSITPRSVTSVCLVSETGYVCYVHYASLCVSGVWDWICLLRPLRLALYVWCLRLDMSVTSITLCSVCLVSETGYVCYVHYASLCVSGVWDWICLLRPLRLSLCVWCLRLDMSVTSIKTRSVCLVSETGYVCYVHYASLSVSGVWWICLLRPLRFALCVWCLRLDMSVTSIAPLSVCLVSETGYVCYVHYASLCVSGVWDWICLLRPLRLALYVWCLRLDMSVTSITPRSVCLVSKTGYVCYVHYALLCVSGVWDWICLLRPLRLSPCVWCLRLDMSVTSITPFSVCQVSETGYVCYVHYASLCVSGVWDWICLSRPSHLALCV